ncbi:MAG TPA: alpha/beta hydrolase, partial [Candidatus Brocadiia bacterium]|nr:alpha/beta hydrolase [Candidatus Brocadiia bacterium]
VAIFFVHGGGWRAGTRQNMHLLMRGCNGRGFICGATDYRLAGVNIFDQIMDTRHGYRLFLDYLAGRGRPQRVCVFGSSAGAHLAALLALAAPGECGEPLAFRDFAPAGPWVPPAGAALQATPVTFEPWPDIFPAIWDSMQDIVGKPYDAAPELYRRVSPIEHLRPGSRPVFFLEAECEHMFPLDLTLKFIAKARALGVRAEHRVYTRAEHGFLYDLTRRQQREAFDDITRFLESL